MKNEKKNLRFSVAEKFNKGKRGLFPNAVIRVGKCVGSRVVFLFFLLMICLLLLLLLLSFEYYILNSFFQSLFTDSHYCTSVYFLII